VWPLAQIRRWLHRARRETLGPRGEKLAGRCLKRKGCRILARNYRCPGGEIDLIALDPSTRETFGAPAVCFVEVKSRRTDRYTDPASAVDNGKRRRLQKAANHYLAARPDARDYPTRFDIVSVVLPPGEPPRVTHYPDAFR
jgi:putative endonuclease